MRSFILTVSLFICLTLGVSNAYASPKCKGSPVVVKETTTSNQLPRWHNCVGTWSFSGSGQKLVADFRNGEPSGQLVHVKADGSKYFGGFISQNFCESNCGKEGHGTKVWSDGTIYVGGWKNNKMHGQGMMTWPMHGEYWIGRFANDKLTDDGFYRKADNSIINTSNVRSDLLCEAATTVRNRATRSWDTRPSFKEFVLEAKRRNLKCDIGSFSTQTKAGTQVKKRKKDFSGLGGFLTGLALCSLAPEPASCLAGIGGKQKKVAKKTNGLTKKTCKDIAGLITCSDRSQMTFIRGTMWNSNGESFLKNGDIHYGDKGSKCEVDKFFPDTLNCK